MIYYQKINRNLVKQIKLYQCSMMLVFNIFEKWTLILKNKRGKQIESVSNCYNIEFVSSSFILTENKLKTIATQPWTSLQISSSLLHIPMDIS